MSGWGYEQYLTVPAFFTNYAGPDWDILVAAAEQGSLTNAVIVVEPYQWVDQGDGRILHPPVETLQSHGAVILGYIPTNGALAAAPTSDDMSGLGQSSRRLADDGTPLCTTAQVEAAAVSWTSLWNTASPTTVLDGFFFDEGPENDLYAQPANGTTPAQPWPWDSNSPQWVEDFYQVVLSDTTGGELFSMLNASQSWDEDTCLDASVALLFEGTAKQYYERWNPAPWYPQPGRFSLSVAHTVVGVETGTDFGRVVRLSKDRGAGYLYVYDGQTAAYDHLPWFFPGLVRMCGVNTVDVGTATLTELSQDAALTAPRQAFYADAVANWQAVS